MVTNSATKFLKFKDNTQNFEDNWLKTIHKTLKITGWL